MGMDTTPHHQTGGMKMTAKHTPGPWTIKGPSAPNRPKTDGGDYAIIADGKIIAEAIYQTDETDFQPVIANARLIAAAPDLLEALKLFVERDCSITTEEFKMGRIAIAKAEAR